MQQMMECLLAKMDTNHGEANAEMKAMQENMDANQAETDINLNKMKDEI
jgi:hypothetical protein